MRKYQDANSPARRRVEPRQAQTLFGAPTAVLRSRRTESINYFFSHQQYLIMGMSNLLLISVTTLFQCLLVVGPKI